MNKEYEYSESCILYLHPNSGSRIDVVKNARIMSIAAHTRCNVCSFDFSGCGESDGDCVSFYYFSFIIYTISYLLIYLFLLSFLD